MKKIYRRFIHEYLKKYKFSYVGILGLLIFQSLIMMAIPLVNSILIDEALPQKNLNLFLLLLAVMGIGYLINHGVTILNDIYLAKFSEKIAADLRTNLNRKLSKLKSKFFFDYNLGDVISRYDSEIDIVKNNCGVMLVECVGNIVKLIILLTVMFFIDYKLTIVLLFGIGIYFLNYSFWGKKVAKYSEEYMNNHSQAIDIITENYSTTTLTKIFNAYGYINKKFEKIYAKYIKSAIRLEGVYSINSNSSSCILVLSMTVVWLIGGLQIINGQLGLGVLLAIISYQGMILGPIRYLSEFNNSFQCTKVSLERIYAIFDYEEETLGTEIFEEKLEGIKFEDVSFEYKGNVILDTVNFELKTNEVTGIIGQSGTGKSTISYLLTGLEESTSGKIFFNNIAIENIEINSLRERVVLITQEATFYKTNIEENLGISGNLNVEEIISLSKKLNLYQDIFESSNGLDTEIALKGTNLSGGQRKRLELLRGFLKNADIIIFDESTANLDEINRKALFDLIAKYKKEKIIVFISHNLQELKNVDKIYMLKDKKVNKLDKVITTEDYINLVNMEVQYV